MQNFSLRSKFRGALLQLSFNTGEAKSHSCAGWVEQPMMHAGLLVQPCAALLPSVRNLKKEDILDI